MKKTRIKYARASVRRRYIPARQKGYRKQCERERERSPSRFSSFTLCCNDDTERVHEPKNLYFCLSSCPPHINHYHTDQKWHFSFWDISQSDDGL